MSVYMITYDLIGLNKNYDGVINAIKTSSDGRWCNYWKSSWLICSNMSASQISTKITPSLDPDDRMIVVEVKNNYQGWMGTEQWDYIRKMFSS